MFSRVLLVVFISVFAAVLAFSFTTGPFELEPTLSLAISLGTGTLVGVIMSFFVVTQAIAPTEFLARAILHVALPDSTVGAPEPSHLGPSKEYLAQLAAFVYDAVSSSPSLEATTQNSMQSHAVNTTSESILQSIALPIFALDANSNVSFVNTAATEFLKLTTKELLGKPVYDVLQLQFVNPTTLEAWLGESKNNTVTSSKNWDRVKLTLPDQTIRQIDIAAHFSKSSSSGIESTIVIFDHTDRYSRDDKDLGFVSLAVHELRTPLTIMRGYIEVFEDELSDKLDVEQSEFMRNMSASVEQLTAFVGNILNVARIEADELTFNLKEESWEEVLKHSVEMMELRARVKHKTLKLTIEPGLPTVGIDTVSMQEVIANLIDNSLKYQHTDEPIEIISYQKNGMVITEVKDHGVGIPQSLIGHVFEKFYRSHRSKKSVSGTGLGLYLCRAIVNAHDGQIWAQSHEGQGATIGFSLQPYSTIAASKQTADGDGITRSAHGWIKNHTLYRR